MNNKIDSEIDILLENKLKREKRSINVYHYASKSAHIISDNSSLNIPLKGFKQEDYLHISLARGPGPMCHPYRLDIPSSLDFDISSDEGIRLTHKGQRSILTISPGLSNWQIKITSPLEFFDNKQKNTITLSDSGSDEQENAA
jgi:hypothetical protein